MTPGQSPPPGCALPACEERRGGERGLSLSALAQRSLPGFGPSARAGGRVLRGGGGPHADQPDRQPAASSAASVWGRSAATAAQVTQTDLLTVFGSARLSRRASEPNVAEVT